MVSGHSCAAASNPGDCGGDGGGDDGGGENRDTVGVVGIGGDIGVESAGTVVCLVLGLCAILPLGIAPTLSLSLAIIFCPTPRGTSA